MIMTIELPDDTLAGFVNYVSGNSGAMGIGVIALSTDDIKSGKATYKACKTVGESED